MIPRLQPVAGGRFEATCFECERTSVPVPAVSAENAWSTLQAIGWTVRGTKGGGAVLLCRKCSAKKKAPSPGLAKALGDGIKQVKRTKQRRAGR
jgi:hypothetical protein